MGLFSSLFGPSKADKEFILQAMKAAGEGEKIALIKSAMSTIDVYPKSEHDIVFVGESCGGLVRAIAGDDPSEEAAITKGMFAAVAANYFSYLVGTSFEHSGQIALLSALGIGNERLHSEIIDLYNKTTAERPQLVNAIGQTIERWTKAPTAENLESLKKLYGIFREGLT